MGAGRRDSPALRGRSWPGSCRAGSCRRLVPQAAKDARRRARQRSPAPGARTSVYSSLDRVNLGRIPKGGRYEPRFVPSVVCGNELRPASCAERGTREHSCGSTARRTGAPGRARSGGSPPRAKRARVPCGARAVGVPSLRWSSRLLWRCPSRRWPAAPPRITTRTSRHTSRPGCSMQSRRDPNATYDVIVQARRGDTTAEVAERGHGRPRGRPRPRRRPAQALPLRCGRGRAAHRQADPQAGPAVPHRRHHAGCTGRPLELQPAALAVRGRPPRALEHAGGRQRTGDRRRRLRHRGRSLRLRHPHRREREPLVPSGQLGRRRARSRHLRGGHRSGQREPLRRRFARIEDRLHRRDGRQRAWP